MGGRGCQGPGEVRPAPPPVAWTGRSCGAWRAKERFCNLLGEQTLSGRRGLRCKALLSALQRCPIHVHVWPHFFRDCEL